MTEPVGNLSPAQFEILQVLWEMGPPGGSVTDIWERIALRRTVVRNTVLNLVDRLEKRGWLSRQMRDGVLHYWPTATRREVEQQVAREFVEGFFGGSTSHLMMSLLGDGQRISPEDLQQLRDWLAEPRRRAPRRRSS